MDYQSSKEILRLIEKVNQKYRNTVMIVTHNDSIKDMADKVLMLRDGEITKAYENREKTPADRLEW